MGGKSGKGRMTPTICVRSRRVGEKKDGKGQTRDYEKPSRIKPAPTSQEQAAIDRINGRPFFIEKMAKR